MKDMFFKKVLWLSLITFKLGDRRFSKSQKIQAQGFTLIELLVAILIVVTLAAIALPSFLNYTQKARFAEAKSYAVNINRLQQAYYMQNAVFTNDLTQLGSGLSSSSSSYNYSLITGDINGNLTTQQLDRIITIVAKPNSDGLQGFASTVAITINSGMTEAKTAYCTSNAVMSSSTVVSPGKINADGITVECPPAFLPYTN